jgi:hypothetical protein
MFFYTLLITFFFIEVFRALYPKDYDIILKIAKQDMDKAYKFTRLILEPKIISLCYNCIYYYSCAQIFFNKTRLFIRPYIKLGLNKIRKLLENYNIIDRLNNYDDSENQLLIEYFYNGILSYSFNFDILNDKIYLGECPANYDFIVCSDYINSLDETLHNNHINKLCISKANLKNDIDFKWGLSNFNFMSLQLVYNDKNYSINLKNDEFNFYIINNILDKTFFRYYLIHILKEENIPIDFTYTLELLDPNVDLHKLNEKHLVILGKDEFTIKYIEDISKNDDNSLTNEIQEESMEFEDS